MSKYIALSLLCDPISIFRFWFEFYRLLGFRRRSWASFYRDLSISLSPSLYKSTKYRPFIGPVKTGFKIDVIDPFLVVLDWRRCFFGGFRSSSQPSFRSR